MDSNFKLLVLGCSRSGTTLLAAALGAHPEVAMLDEDQDGAIDKITGGKIAGVKLCVPNQIDWDRKWHWLYSPGMMNGYFRKSLFMAKIPRMRETILDFIEQRSPLKIVGIIRHPDDVINSIMVRENRSRSLANYRWQQCIKAMQNIHSSDVPSIIVEYEKFVNNPKLTCNKLCDFLGIPFDGKMLEAPSRNSRYSQTGFRNTKNSDREVKNVVEDKSLDAYHFLKQIAI